MYMNSIDIDYDKNIKFKPDSCSDSDSLKQRNSVSTHECDYKLYLSENGKKKNIRLYSWGYYFDIILTWNAMS